MKGRVKAVLRDRASGRDAAVGWTIAGEALAFESRSSAELGKLRGDLNGGERARLLEASDGNFYGLVGLRAFAVSSALRSSS